MANIIRCELPDGIHRFKPFTVEDYRDFLLVRNDITSKTEEEQSQILDELQKDYFPEYPRAQRAYIFLKVFLSSIGKTKIPVRIECPVCGNTKAHLFNLHQEPMIDPEIEVAGLKIKFKFPEKDYGEDLASMVTENIVSVKDDNSTYLWTELSDENKLQVIEALDIETFENIITKMSVFNFTLKTSCCRSQEIKYRNFKDLFNLLLHPDEIFTFYKINHHITKQGYSLESIMRMIPIERGITLSLIEKDLS